MFLLSSVPTTVIVAWLKRLVYAYKTHIYFVLLPRILIPQERSMHLVLQYETQLMRDIPSKAYVKFWTKLTHTLSSKTTISNLYSLIAPRTYT